MKAINYINDSDYIESIKSGQWATTKWMISKVARISGYNIGPVYHGTENPNFTVFDCEVNHFGTEQAAHEIMKKHGGRYIDYTIDNSSDGIWVFADRDYLHIKSCDGMGPFNTLSEAEIFISNLPKEIKLYEVFLNIDNPTYDIDAGGTGAWRRAKGRAVKEGGYDGIIYKNEVEDPGSESYAVFYGNQIKLADPITYDDNGDIIPLSRRFNRLELDIRY